jgi:hypothetical protein
MKALFQETASSRTNLRPRTVSTRHYELTVKSLIGHPFAINAELQLLTAGPLACGTGEVSDLFSIGGLRPKGGRTPPLTGLELTENNFHVSLSRDELPY